MSEKLYKASDVIGILLEEITNAEFLRVAKRLSDIPSAVVRCKDCVHKDVPCPLYGGSQFFCAYGEREKE